MTYPRTEESLERFIDAALAADPDVYSRIEAANYSYESLSSRVVANAPALWEAVNEEIREYDRLQDDIDRLTVDAEQATPAPRSGVAAVEHWFSRGEAVAAALLIPSMLALLLSGGSWLWTTWVGSTALFELAVASKFATWSGAACVALFGALMLQQFPKHQLVSRKMEQHRRRYLFWEHDLNNALVVRGVPLLRENLKEKRYRIDEHLTGRIQSEIVSLINQRLEPSYSKELSVHEPRGLGEVFDRRLTISTPARSRLDFLLSNMPGGSIGIAGSRGAGKTTLLRNFCGPNRVVEELNGKEVLGILVSAPVVYQARDFLLYLFTVTCQNVIEAEGGTFRPPEIATDPSPHEETRSWSLAKRVPMALTRSGLAFFFLGLIAAFLVAMLHPSPSSVEKSSQSLVAPSGAADPKSAGTTAAPDAKSTTQERARHGADKPSNAAEAPSSGSTGDRAVNEFLSRWLTAIAISPSSFLVPAGVLIAAGLLLAQLMSMSAVRLLRRALWSILFPFAYRRQAAEAAAYASRRNEGNAGGASTAASGSLQAEAESWLMTTKFQQSYTSGWSGSLKLPIGLEGGLNRAVNLAKNQMSVPELVYFLNRFLERVSSQYQVVVGIDELDKLASHDLARQFINDIKSLFGVEGCFYLVSVSEDAMSSFERRGLPLRDEFDSAFDEVLYVDYLNFNHATSLLDRRVVGRPIPFFAFSFCMSGGLPRDLIRTFRAVLEVHARNGERGALAAIVGSIITSDILAKSRAASVAARSLRLEPELDQFFTVLTQIELGSNSNRTLMDIARNLLASAEAAELAGGSKETRVGDRFSNESDAAASPVEIGAEGRLRPLRDLMEEIATYIDFVVTMRSFFGGSYDEKRLRSAIEDGHIDRIAHARRLIAVYPRLARTELSRFRTTLQVYPQDN